MPLEIPGYTYHQNGYYTMEPSSSQVKRDLKQRVAVDVMLQPLTGEAAKTIWGEKKPLGQQLSLDALLGLAGSIGGARESLQSSVTDIRQYNTLREYRETIRETFTTAPAPTVKGADFGGFLGGLGAGAALVAVLLFAFGMGKK